MIMAKMPAPTGGSLSNTSANDGMAASEALMASKGGSYIIGRKMADDWEPGAPIERPPTSSQSMHTYLPLPNGQVLRLTYGSASEQGRAPRPPHKPNQDSFVCLERLGNDSSVAVFGCFDGHGPRGEDASNFCRVNLPDVCVRHAAFKRSPFEALVASFEGTHRRFVAPSTEQAGVDTAVSGTTAVVVMFQGTKWMCANVGDSRAMIATARPDGRPGLIAQPISNDHKPQRTDERQRIAKSAAKVLSERTLGIEGGDPNKLYVCRVHNGSIRYGVLFTRSIGDADGHANLGLTAKPEIKQGTIDPSRDRAMVIATDGVWDYFDERAVADLVVASGEDAHAAAHSIVGAAKAKWDSESVNGRRDDITAVVVTFKVLSAAEAKAEQDAAAAANETAGSSTAAGLQVDRDDSSALKSAVISEATPVSTPNPNSAGSVEHDAAAMQSQSASSSEDAAGAK